MPYTWCILVGSTRFWVGLATLYHYLRAIGACVHRTLCTCVILILLGSSYTHRLSRAIRASASEATQHMCSRLWNFSIQNPNHNITAVGVHSIEQIHLLTPSHPPPLPPPPRSITFRRKYATYMSRNGGCN